MAGELLFSLEGFLLPPGALVLLTLPELLGTPPEAVGFEGAGSGLFGGSGIGSGS